MSYPPVVDLKNDQDATPATKQVAEKPQMASYPAPRILQVGTLQEMLGNPRYSGYDDNHLFRYW